MYDNYFKPSSIKVKKGQTVKFIIENKGEEVISEKHDKDFESKKENKEVVKPKSEESEDVIDEEEIVEEEKDFADVDFENDDE